MATDSRLNLLGKKIGFLTVLSEAEKIGESRVWNVQCECGNKKTIRQGNLITRGGKFGCGCKRKKIFIEGQTFNYLTAIKRTNDNKNRTIYLCKCVCGNITNVRAESLMSGHTKSCGCKSREITAIALTKNILGEKYGLLTVIEKADNIDGDTAWVVKCNCGTIKILRSEALRNKSGTQSCGCLWQSKKYTLSYKHGYSKNDNISSEYNSWLTMKARCLNPRTPNYKNYGGRGITICSRWIGEDGFINFIKDMKDKPTKNHQIDRIDNDGNYELSNCKWSTRKEQMRNRRNSVFYEYNGVRKCLAEWIEYLFENTSTMRWRLKKHNYNFQEVAEKYYKYNLQTI